MAKKPSHREIVDGMLDAILRKYSYLVIRQNEFNQAKAELESKVMNIKDYSDLMRLAIHSFSIFRDTHIRIIDGQGNSTSTYQNQVPKNYDPNVTSKYFDDAKTEGPITVGKIGEILYVGIDGFNSRNKKSFDWLNSLEYPKESKFIIDLRANGGGNESLGLPLVSMLTGAERSIVAGYFRYRTDESDPTKLTEFRPKYNTPDIRSFRRQAIVLTGAKTFSSGEGVTLSIAAIPGTLLFGDVTGGGSGCPQRYLVGGPNSGKKIPYEDKPNDHGASFGMDIPSWLAYRLDQVLIQDNGIPPHLHIKPQDSIVNGRDMVLEKAIDAHKNGYIAR